jgi:hypothetical protein
VLGWARNKIQLINNLHICIKGLPHHKKVGSPFWQFGEPYGGYSFTIYNHYQPSVGSEGAYIGQQLAKKLNISWKLAVVVKG